jgi:transposase
VDVSSLSNQEDILCQEHVHHIHKNSEIGFVELARKGRKPSELAEEFEPTEQTIRNWLKQADRDDGKRADRLSTDECDGLRRLRKKLRQMKQERDILAKATAWFARETGEVPPKSSDS